jgi:hypothetical protein
MERGYMMVIHSLIIGVLLYVAMVFGLGQKAEVAENRSILIGAGVLIYMVLFGHGPPTKLNRML